MTSSRMLLTFFNALDVLYVGYTRTSNGKSVLKGTASDSNFGLSDCFLKKQNSITDPIFQAFT